MTFFMMTGGLLLCVCPFTRFLFKLSAFFCVTFKEVIFSLLNFPRSQRTNKQISEISKKKLCSGNEKIHRNYFDKGSTVVMT
jgi:hypothetical protein